MTTAVFAYHNMGCMGLRTLLDLAVAVDAVFTYSDDADENCWFGSVAGLCRERGLRHYLDVDLKDEKWTELLAGLKPEVIWSFYYRSLIPERVLKLARRGAVNLHGSLLPKYRGRCPVNWQILNGEKQAGATLHYMDAGADTGDIIAQTPVAIGEEDTALTLFGKLEAAGEKLLRANAAAIMAGTAPRTKQDHSQATVFGGRRPEDGRIKPDMTSREVYNLVRAVTRPYPGAFARNADGSKTVIWKCRVTNDITADAAPGALFWRADKKYVKTTDGAVEVLDSSQA